MTHGQMNLSHSHLICACTSSSCKHKSLVPKARDSYTCMHLMERDDRPFDYVVVLGLPNPNQDKAILLGIRDKLRSRLDKETGEPWRRRYIRECVVLTPETWPKAFPHYPIRRISAP